jgi:hypothetical protein
MGISCQLRSELEGLILIAFEQGTDRWDINDLVDECEEIYNQLLHKAKVLGNL